MEERVDLGEPLLPTSHEVSRTRLKRRCYVITLVIFLAGVITLAVGLSLPDRRFAHGTRLLSPTHVINATHVVELQRDEERMVLHDEAEQTMTLHLGKDEYEHEHLLRAKYRRPHGRLKGVVLKEGDPFDDIKLPTVLAYARMASSAYDFTHTTIDSETGDTARGKGEGYRPQSDDQSHVKAVIYESGVYSCYWWCRFWPDTKGKNTANVIVAFKGTTKIGWTMRSDFLTDADMFIFSIATNETVRDAVMNGPHIRRYWQESLAVVDTVKRLYPNTTTLQLSFTGHSLGGVLAGLHAVKNNAMGIGFNSPPGSRVAEIVGVINSINTTTTNDMEDPGKNTTDALYNSFCTFNVPNDVLSDQSPPDVIPILNANRGGLDLLFLGAQAKRVADFLRSKEYEPQRQVGRVAQLNISGKVNDVEELHSIVTVVDFLEAIKAGRAQAGDMRCV